MDVNDVIHELADADAESTLESEIDALSKIICDTKDGAPKLEDNDEDADDITLAGSHDTTPDDELGEKDISSGFEVQESFIPTAASNAKAALNKISELDDNTESNKIQDSIVEESKADTNDSEDFNKTDSQDELTSDTKKYSASNSLSLINEAYTSQESQSCPDDVLETALEDKTKFKLEINKDNDLNVIENIKNLSRKKDDIEVSVTDSEPKTEQIATDLIEPLISEHVNKTKSSPAKECLELDLIPEIEQNQEMSNVENDKIESNIDNLQKNDFDSESFQLEPSVQEIESDKVESSEDDNKLENVENKIEIDNSCKELSTSSTTDQTEIKEGIEDITKSGTLEPFDKSEDSVDDANISNLKTNEVSNVIFEKVTADIETIQSTLTGKDFEPYEENENKEQDDCGTKEHKETRADQSDNDVVKEIKNSSHLSKETENNASVNIVNSENVQDNIESIDKNRNSASENIKSIMEVEPQSILEHEKESVTNIEPMETVENVDVNTGASSDFQEIQSFDIKTDANIEEQHKNQDSEFISSIEQKESNNTQSLESIEIKNKDLVKANIFDTQASEIEDLSEVEEKEEFMDCIDYLEDSENLKDSNIDVNTENIDNVKQAVSLDTIENIKDKSPETVHENLQENKSSDNIETIERQLISEISENLQSVAETENIKSLENIESDDNNDQDLQSKEDNEIIEDHEKDDFTLQVESTNDNESEESSYTKIQSTNLTGTDVKEIPEILDEESENKIETNDLIENPLIDEALEDEKPSQSTEQIENIEMTSETNIEKNIEDENTDTSVEVPESEESIIDKLPKKSNLEKEADTDLATSSAQFEETEVPKLHDAESEVVNEEPTIETSELETALKFLQESEEQNIEAPKIDEDQTVEEKSNLYVPIEDDICENAADLTSDVNETEATYDPISISEAEIISEAAKLESEKEKLEQKQQLEAEVEESTDMDTDEPSNLPATDDLLSTVESSATSFVSEIPSEGVLQMPILPEIKLTSKTLPKAAIVEDRYKEPPQIEIPDASQIIDLPSDTLQTSEFVVEEDEEEGESSEQLSSPERPTISSEPKITETPKKEVEKQLQAQPQLQPYSECENVGSPRIILKIAKSAIADCSEPRSPKSPKIRSAANSPNPDDSPSHKLGKIKLKLSKGGHPSIIPSSDSGFDETAQWHTEASSTLTAHGGVKIKLAKMADADKEEDEAKEKSSVHKQKHRESKEVVQETTVKKQDSLGMKIKLSKSGDASIIQQDNKLVEDQKEAKAKDKAVEDVQEGTRRTESPLGMKIKLSKSGDASIISSEYTEEIKEKLDVPEVSKKSKSKERLEMEETDADLADDSSKVTSKGVKIKLAKTSDMRKDDESVKKSNEQPLGMMKIKLSKTGDPSIIHPEIPKETDDVAHGIKIKHSKNKDHSSTGQQKSKDDSHLEMKIKLSKTGHPTIINTSDHQEDFSKSTVSSIAQSLKHKDHKDMLTFKESTLKEIKKSHSDVTIEPVASKSVENTMMDLHNKRKEITIAPIESKKSKIETSMKQMLPDITIQPITKKEQPSKKLLLDSKAGSISQQQMNVINQEISITQVCSLATGDVLLGEHLKNTLQAEPPSASPLNSDCEIIDPQPELIIVNENSNSSQDVMIIDEVPPIMKATRMPKKRGRPRRIGVGSSVVPTSSSHVSAPFQQFELARDPLSLDQPVEYPLQQNLSAQLHQQHLQHSQAQISAAGGGEASGERPRRTCRSQKSYAPPKRGRGRGRGKRKYESVDVPMKRQRIEQDLTEIEKSTTAIISLEKLPLEVCSKSPELFKALSQPTLHRIDAQSALQRVEIPSNLQRTEIQSNEVEITPASSTTLSESESQLDDEPLQESEVNQEEIYETKPDEEINTETTLDTEPIASTSIEISDQHMEEEFKTNEDANIDQTNVIDIKITSEGDSEKQADIEEGVKEPTLTAQEPQNWLAPSIKKISAEPPTTSKTESISTLTVMDEDTRMSAESGSRSQTPARNVPVTGVPEALAANEESQGSVLSTATTESEKVKVRIRRMEINLDPDEGPFTVEKIAEYEWPHVDRKDNQPAGRGETFMIQEQISQYLGVKSFKRKYPDLKRRMVDMEERNYLRENHLVSEAMCDMGLTAVASSEVLDIMCSDFPEQYEEYRKYMREKAAKEHSKKQKELSAAANAERNRLDLAEMAMQSAIAWNVGLNRARQETRKCSLDLQTFTVHVPLKRGQFTNGYRYQEQPKRNGNNYPVAVIPGQYAEYYREYTPAELRYYPLNTVLYGPMRPNERKFDSQSEGSQSDSDSDSSSDDSSSSSSEGTQDTEDSRSAMEEVDEELASQSDLKCKVCSNNLNKNNRPEVLIQCGACSGHVHPSCIDLTLDMVPHIRAYAWQCTDCKNCAQCHDPADEDKMLFCDMCDRGYHIYCVGLRRVPQGRWHCQECAVCANCGSKEPGGANSDRNSVAQWQHEFKKGDKNTRVYVSTFCVPCSKLWRKGRYCPHCSRCHNAPRLDLEPNLVHCGACDKYLHLDCVETKGVTIDKKNYLCDFCSPNRQQTIRPLVSKTFKT